MMTPLVMTMCQGLVGNYEERKADDGDDDDDDGADDDDNDGSDEVVKMELLFHENAFATSEENNFRTFFGFRLFFIFFNSKEFQIKIFDICVRLHRGQQGHCCVMRSVN